MTVALPPALDQSVSQMLATGRYADEGEIMREPLSLEAALLEGVRAPHRAYDSSVLDSIRAATHA